MKRLFKDSEKEIRIKSVSSSRRSLVGKFIERFVPFLSQVPFAPSDMHFLGQPIDYIVFEGLRDNQIEKIVFLEVKTGNSKLTKREESLKDAVNKKKVYWKEVRVNTESKEIPDKEIENKETSLKELYEHITKKIKSVKPDAEINSMENEDVYEKDEIESYDVNCPNCDEDFTLELEADDDLEKGVKINCPHCKKIVKITEEDI
mgnify:CR=1 FL=1